MSTAKREQQSKVMAISYFVHLLVHVRSHNSCCCSPEKLLCQMAPGSLNRAERWLLRPCHAPLTESWLTEAHYVVIQWDEIPTKRTAQTVMGFCLPICWMFLRLKGSGFVQDKKLEKQEVIQSSVGSVSAFL